MTPDSTETCAYLLSGLQKPKSSETRTHGAVILEARQVNSEKIKDTGPDLSLFVPPTSSSSPLSEKPHPQADSTFQTGEEEEVESISLRQCRQVANELQEATQRAVLLYRQQVGRSERRPESSSVLQEAFANVHGELQAVMQPACSGVPSGQMQDDQTMFLLEKYSELLVQMTLNKLNKI
ncbi:hypothetical protein XENORESO_015478 [Xenotaenia resolanae]|uniref:Uncharacterized protein n=1 Tax=Xenotaenia resolanae TaxID=208358 RepID=A0ABV0WX10_9TELE